MALIDLMEAYTNEVRTTFSQLTQATGLARGTVVHAVRLFEERSVIERLSGPHRLSHWRVRPCYASKAVLLKRQGVCGHDDIRYYGHLPPKKNQ
jgi:DNA-binding MarR family transcriptional regulator